MNAQHYKNHTRISFSYHILTGLSIIALLIGSIINAVNSAEGNFYSATLLVLVSLILLSHHIHIRSFALKAQDRAIRAEENLRHFALSGKLLDPRLHIGQIIALRFAPDQELVPLAKEAVTQNLSNKEIKKRIQNWRPDVHRV